MNISKKHFSCLWPMEVISSTVILNCLLFLSIILLLKYLEERLLIVPSSGDCDILFKIIFISFFGHLNFFQWLSISEKQVFPFWKLGVSVDTGEPDDSTGRSAGKQATECKELVTESAQVPCHAVSFQHSSQKFRWKFVKACLSKPSITKNR